MSNFGDRFPPELLPHARSGGMSEGAADARYLKLAGGTLTGDVTVADDVALGFGAPDVKALWDTAETTDLMKIGLPAAGKALVIGPVADNGVDRYGASPPPFGVSVRADDATATNRIDLLHDGTHGYIYNRAGGEIQIGDATGVELRVGNAQVYVLRDLLLADTRNIKVSSTTGSKIGTASTEKLAFWGATPVVQQAHVADPAGGATIDAEARTAINSINALCATLGLTAAA